MGILGDLYEQNDVSVSKVQFRFKVFIPRIPSVFRYRGKSLALYIPSYRPALCSTMLATTITAFNLSTLLTFTILMILSSTLATPRFPSTYCCYMPTFFTFKAPEWWWDVLTHLVAHVAYPNSRW